jgi:hypothetical protein
MSCDTNEKPIDCPQSIEFSSPSVSLVEKDDILEVTSCEAVEEAPVCDNNTSEECRALLEEPEEVPVVPIPKLSITMPSSHVVEISQTFYWPLYTKPIDWIYQEHHPAESAELQRRLRQTAEKLQSMSFFQAKQQQQQIIMVADEGAVADAEAGEVDDGVETVIRELQEEKEDWFSDLSGGQKSKVELVRKVFLHERCPNVVLIDETFAPLDPTSKLLVMSKIKDFCKGSIVIVIYHADIGHGQETEEGKTVECVPSSDFFDHNIHLENQIIKLRPVC